MGLTHPLDTDVDLVEMLLDEISRLKRANKTSTENFIFDPVIARTYPPAISVGGVITDVAVWLGSGAIDIDFLVNSEVIFNFPFVSAGVVHWQSIDSFDLDERDIFGVRVNVVSGTPRDLSCSFIITP